VAASTFVSDISVQERMFSLPMIATGKLFFVLMKTVFMKRIGDEVRNQRKRRLARKLSICACRV
jgi:hypothetical protein